MSSIRGLPRRSKTAVVVVIVVFLQMLALAVVGIGAIQENRETSRRTRIAENEAAGRKAITDLRQAVLADLNRLLGASIEAASWSELERARRRATYPIVRQVFHVLPNGTVSWVDGVFVLYQPPSVIQALQRGYEPRLATARALGQRLSTPLAPPARLQTYVEALKSFPLLIEDGGFLDGEPQGTSYPFAVAWAHNMLDGPLVDAARMVGGAEHDTVRFAILQALVVQGLSRGRKEIGPFERALVEDIDDEVMAALPQLPSGVRGDLPAEVHAFLAHQAFLAQEGTRTHFQSFLDAGRETLGDTIRTEPYLKEAGPELFAMAAPGNGSIRVLRLDAGALKQWIQALGGKPEYAIGRFGMELRVRQRGTGAPREEQGLLQVQPIENAELRLPFELARYKVADVVGDTEGRSEVWYWAIIALAGLGLLFGGGVLVRLWRREVRVAQLKADFVSNLSHELKTPLTSISLFTEMLRDGKLDGSPADQAEAYQVLDLEAQRLQRIVQRMIETARNEAQGTPYNLAPGDLNRPVLEATNRFRRIVTESGLDLHISLAPEPLPMMLDASAMDDAVTNLLSNAWKYKRGDTACISVETRRQGRSAELLVTDDGIGIPRSQRRRVFETFYRAEQFLTQPVAGTGLGLALVRAIARAHRGRVRLRPAEPGPGTTFRLRFPLSRRAAYAAAHPSIQADNPSDADPTARAGDDAHESVENTGATA